MRKAPIAALAVVAALLSAPAHAQLHFSLVKCEAATSVTGRFIYVGTYSNGLQVVQRNFTSYCPPSLQVY